MKILQLNIWGGKLGKQIIDLIEREKPDVVCLQEAIVLPHEGTLLFTQFADIQSETKFEHSYFSPAFGFTMMNHRADFGNAVMSHTPFVNTKTVFTGGDYNPTIDLVDGDFNMRNLQHVIIDNGGKKINILNHHGHHIRQHKMGDAETLRQCEMIVEYISKLEGGVVLTGDFNLAPESESLGKLNVILTNHAMESGVTTTRTPLTHKTEVCDYIFTSKELKTAGFKVLPDLVSDHAALVIEVE